MANLDPKSTIIDPRVRWDSIHQTYMCWYEHAYVRRPCVSGSKCQNHIERKNQVDYIPTHE